MVGERAAVERVLRGARMVFPVGPRRWSRRWLFSLPVLAGTALVAWGWRTTEAELPPDEGAATATADVASPDTQETNPTPLLSPTSPSSLRPNMSNALGLADASLRTPFVELGALDSLPHEDLDTFLTRVAQAMDTFTRRTHHEVCGVIMVNDNQDKWRVRMTTNRSHISCVMVVFDEPGFKRLGPDIHSHPRVTGGALANAQDIQRNKRFECGQNMVVFDETFSTKDLERGPGYLVSRNRLMYQRGKSFPFQQRAVFASLETMPDLTLLSGEMGRFESGEVASDTALPLQTALWENQDTPGLPPTQCPQTNQQVVDERMELGLEKPGEALGRAVRPRMR